MSVEEGKDAPSAASSEIRDFVLGIVQEEDSRREGDGNAYVEHWEIHQWSGDVARAVRDKDGLEQAIEEWVTYPRWIARVLVSGVKHIIEHGSFTVWALSDISYASQRGEEIPSKEQVTDIPDPEGRHARGDDFDHYLDWIQDYVSKDPDDNSSPCTECGMFVDIDNYEYCPWCDTVGDPHDPDWDHNEFTDRWEEYHRSSWRKYFEHKRRQEDE